MRVKNKYGFINERGSYNFDFNDENESKTFMVSCIVVNENQLERNTEIMIGNIKSDDVLFVVYTERIRKNENGAEIDVTRLISARYATNFERGLYYGKY